MIPVDVREADEYAAGHIKGALFNPLSKFDPARLPVARPGQKGGDLLPLGPPFGHCDGAGAAFWPSRRDTHFGGGILAWLGANLEVEKGL